MAFAKSRLPSDLNSRVDEEDVVQSVFRSFFRRNQEGQFRFDTSYDVWQLLAAITYRKVVNTIRHHRRNRRDSKRDQNEQASGPITELVDRTPTPEELNVMFDYLRWIMEQLPETQKQILQLRLEGFSIGEIAEQVELSQRSVKRGLARIRDLIQARNEQDSEHLDLPVSP